LPLAAAGVAVVLGLLSMTGRMTAGPFGHSSHADMVHDGR